MERILTCIECPRGCTLTVNVNSSEVSVAGNFCPKGEIYGKNEVVCPKRIITGTVRAGKDGEILIPVKTDKSVNKSIMFDVMAKIHSAKVLKSVKIGDIIIENVDGDGANVVSAAPVCLGE